MCGIFGAIANRKVSFDKFKLLGIYNVSRGEDSSGLAIGDEVVKDAGKGADFPTWITTLTTNNYENSVKRNAWSILGHTRKSSVGYVNKNNAHPHKIEIKDKATLVGVHNGTIRNWYEIARKNNFNTANTTDSVLMFTLIAEANKDFQNMGFFLDYEGAGTFVWYYTDEPNVFYIFKGKSSLYNYHAAEEERPLHYWVHEKAKTCYISSMPSSLLAIGAINDFKEDNKPVQTFKCNVILKVYMNEEGKLVQEEVGSYDRENFRKTEYTKNHTSSSNFTSKLPVQKAFFEEDEGFPFLGGGCQVSHAPIKKNLPLEIKLENLKNTYLQCSIDSTLIRELDDVVYFDQMLYKSDYKKLSGKFKIDEFGRLESHPSFNEISAKTYFFYKGIMAKDEKSYEEMISLDADDMFFTRPYELNNKNSLSISRYAAQPVSTDKLFMTCKDGSVFTGTYEPLFLSDVEKINFVNGVFTSISKYGKNEMQTVIDYIKKKKEEDENSEYLLELFSELVENGNDVVEDIQLYVTHIKNHFSDFSGTKYEPVLNALLCALSSVYHDFKCQLDYSLENKTDYEEDCILCEEDHDPHCPGCLGQGKVKVRPITAENLNTKLSKN